MTHRDSANRRASPPPKTAPGPLTAGAAAACLGDERASRPALEFVDTATPFSKFHLCAAVPHRATPSWQQHQRITNSVRAADCASSTPSSSASRLITPCTTTNRQTEKKTAPHRSSIATLASRAAPRVPESPRPRPRRPPYPWIASQHRFAAGGCTWGLNRGLGTACWETRGLRNNVDHELIGPLRPGLPAVA